MKKMLTLLKVVIAIGIAYIFSRYVFDSSSVMTVCIFYCILAVFRVDSEYKPEKLTAKKKRILAILVGIGLLFVVLGKAVFHNDLMIIIGAMLTALVSVLIVSAVIAIINWIKGETGMGKNELNNVSNKKANKKAGKIIGIIVLAVVLLVIVVYAAVAGYVTLSAAATKEVHRDVSEYACLEDGTNVLTIFADREEAGGCIWPEEIADSMDVQDYLLVYYCPWDSNYLGYLTVLYEESDYEAEVERLEEYPSTGYIGNYGATGFADYEVLAMSAGDYGFVYALTDGKETIIYVAMVFPGYGMDIEYEKYVPAEYLPEGLDAGEDNPTRQEAVSRYKNK